MAEEPLDNDLEAWHRRFAVDANNRAWMLSEKEHATEDERTEMLQAAHAAGYHWSKVGQPDQIAQSDLLLGRVHSILGHGELAMRFAPRVR